MVGHVTGNTTYFGLNENMAHYNLFALLIQTLLQLLNYFEYSHWYRTEWINLKCDQNVRCHC